MKRFLPSFFFFIAFFSFLAGSNGAISPVVFDTLTPDRKYTGYRLHVADIKRLKSKNDELFLSCTLANTGKFDVNFSKGRTMPYLQLTFDQSLAANELAHLQENFREGLLSQTLKIKLGQVVREVNLKINATPPVSSETKSQPVALREKSAPPKNDSDPKEIAIKKGTASNEVFEKPVFETRPVEDILSEKNICPDLVFDTIVLVKTDGKTATFEYKISNIGKGPANLYGDPEEADDNVALRAFISGSAALSKGALVIGGDFIKSGLDPSNGILHPGKSFKGTLTLDIRRKTRYLPMIILSVDAYMKLHECDRANNTKAILVE